jgi:hypothetical protein
MECRKKPSAAATPPRARAKGGNFYALLQCSYLQYSRGNGEPSERPGRLRLGSIGNISVSEDLPMVGKCVHAIGIRRG